MKLQDFLKCKKVRCLSNDYDFNEQGKAYKLHGLRVFITDETGCTAFLPIEDFEPVLDSAENPLQKMELTPKFEVENSVLVDNCQANIQDIGTDILDTNADIKDTPKPLTGSDLCFEKLRNGKKLVMCAVSDLSDEKAIKRLQDGDNCIRIIKDCDPAPYHFVDVHGIRHGFAVPLNDETGEPLTQAVVNE